MKLTLYSRPGCHLCEELKDDLAGLRPIVDFELAERNIEDEPALWEQFRYLIPVLDVEGGTLLYPPHDRTTILFALTGAQR
jgi:hypothetical protein